jgi:acyl-coenzyme A thioesterase PaaI-like protein
MNYSDSADRPPPEGFVRHGRISPLTAPWEPLYERALPDRLVLGLWLRTPHTNTRGAAHGGLIAALADKAMGLSCAIVRGVSPATSSEPASFVTVSLGVDYLETARIGQWFVVDTSFVKAGRSLCFAGADLTADGVLVARAHATFRVVAPQTYASSSS